MAQFVPTGESLYVQILVIIAPMSIYPIVNGTECNIIDLTRTLPAYEFSVQSRVVTY